MTAGVTNSAASAAKAHRRDTGVGEGFEEVHREQHHHRHRQRHDGRGEQHGAPGGHHHREDRVLAVGAVGHLVAVSADHQQCVVDRERETHCGAEVQREDRHVGEQGDAPQDGEGAQDRHPADRDGHRGRQESTEHPHQHREAQRYRQRLHQQQVALRLFGDLHVDHRGAAGAHGHPVAVVDQFVGQLCGAPRHGVLGTGDPGDDQP
jgi:hypothetical protein